MDHVKDVNNNPVSTEEMINWYYAETLGLRPSGIRFIDGSPFAIFKRPEAGIYGPVPKAPKGFKPTIEQIVSDSTWQEIREQLIGTWIENAPAAVGVLRAYLGDFTDPFKVRRVLNYLTGTGFRTGTIQHESVERLLTEVPPWAAPR